MILDKILGVVSGAVTSVAEHFFPAPEDKTKRMELQLAINAAVLERSAAIELAAAEIVKAEAGGASFMQRSWRPITMLTFLALIVARWLGFSAPMLSEAEVMKLWDITELGLGGYVIGRSAEKILPSLLGGKK